MGTITCNTCQQPFGNHAESCAVKFRDITNPDPEVQKQHEERDEYYAKLDAEGGTPFDGLSVKLPETP